MSKKEYKVTTNQWRAFVWGSRAKGLAYFTMLWIAAASVIPEGEEVSWIGMAAAMFLYIAGQSIDYTATDKSWEEREE